MAVEGVTGDLIKVVSLLGAGVVAVPLFKRLGLGSVLGYFTAGLAIGPYGLGLFSHPASVLHVAEFGVVMFLFIIGLEMQPSRLWNLRREIFGLGAAQVTLCGALLTGVGYAYGLPLPAAFIAGMGFVLSSTAVVMQMLNERGETSTPQGQQAVSILLLEDLAIVPLLAVVALLAPFKGDTGSGWLSFGIGVASVGGLVLAGRYLLNPMFRLLALAHAREVMTAAALLVVLGAALAMQLGGLSMAMGAFLAGVLLSESSFRHQLEADIEPFRGILLGLFFLAVGMSLDLGVIAAQWRLIALAVLAFMSVKALGIFIVAKLFRSRTREAVTRVALFSQGGEFAFVLYGAALAAGIFDGQVNAIASATVIISMALTPLLAIALDRFMPPEEASLDGVELAEGLNGRVLIIGFGRFGQVASQALLARGFSVSIIEVDVELIKAAADFGFKVHYGDGTRAEILHASGAERAEAILVCVEDRNTADRIVAVSQEAFPHAKLFVRAFDRGHSMDLIRAGVEYQIRETFESAMAFGTAVLLGMGVPQDEAVEIAEDVRRRDAERLDLQVASDIYAGVNLIRGNAPIPAPLTKPKAAGRVHGNVPDDVGDF
ncbi:MAG TPA: monovalent cation:proton antiporter-2 (CPA2) family protein [Bosea sp. (in: a-proteobacteria)]|jgi:glutathione-regulated potassium-efflux system protein KefB|uniref:monovalent cation:proton antiporter-2 (CPA2) family protein n=1 Tax=Bosea sp. (in: a-proteobacteria) TaxID=1871050 RepID=UPI002E106737|nr:monovalent cation:proton antiporter-2 (CPA2) family protein [Bosea sp. (in: a-proteobacteria)]